MRRRGILAALVGGLAAVVGVWLGWFRKRSDGSGTDADTAELPPVPAASEEETAVVAALAQAFEYLRLEQGVALAFVRDHQKYRAKLPRVPLGARAKKEFLLSTNFVQQGTDESKSIAYVAFYSPYDNPCYNPFTARQR